LKIYIFTFTFYPESNGVANVVLNQAKHFLNAGHEVYIVTSPNIDRDKKDHQIKHFNIIEFNIRGSFKLYNFYRGNIFKYLQFLKTLKADIAFFHCWQIWSTDLFFLIKKKDYNYKTVIVSHCTGINSSKTFTDKINKILFYPYRYIIKVLMKKADKLVFLSNKLDLDRYYDAMIVKELGLENKKVVIPNGVEKLDSIIFDPYILQKYQLLNKNYLVYVSNYQTIKNQEFALDIFENILYEYDIIFIGGYQSKYLDKLTKKRQKSTKAKHIHFLVNIPRYDMLSIVSLAKVFLFTSNNECAPLSVLEPLSLGVPVVSTDVGDVNMLENVLVESDIDNFVNVLNNLLGNEQSYS